MRPVVVESPYAGDVDTNLRYLRAALADCIRRGETPYASHALLTQPGVLDDSRPEERELGMKAGSFMSAALALAGAQRVFYVDRGWSKGMAAGLDDARRLGQEVEFRTIDGWKRGS